MKPTDTLRIVDLQVAIYAAGAMLGGANSKDAIESAQAVFYDSMSSTKPATEIAHLLCSFARTVRSAGE